MDRQRDDVSDPFSDPFDAERAATATVDSRGIVVRWSAAAERLTAYPAAEILGRRVAELLGGAGTAAPEEEVTGLLRAGRPWQGVVLVRRKDGGRATLAVRAYPSVGPGDSPCWVLLAAEAAETRRRQREWAALEALFTHSPLGLMISDTQLRCVRRNPALERMTGIPNRERLGRRIGETVSAVDAAQLEAAMRQVLESGTPMLELLQRGAVPAVPHRESIWSANLFRLQDPDGRVIGVCHEVLDVTDRRRAEERVALLNEASLRIGTTLDVVRTAQELAEVAAPRLADTVAVDLLDPVLRGELAPEPTGAGMVLRRAGYRSAWKGPSRAAYRPGELSWFPPSSPQIRCMADLQARLVRLAGEDREWLAEDPRRREAVRAAEAHSLLAVPLVARDVLMGVASFYRWQKPYPFDDEDLALATELAARAAVCIDNARRYTRERSATLTLQRRLLPRVTPVLTGLEVAGRYQPAGEESEVGGDWLDVIPLSGARVALVVGDVPGHGLHASATMGRLRTAVHTLADLDLPPDELLTHLDDLVGRLAEEEAGTPGERPVDGAATGSTCLYAVYDPVERRCTLASAGHYPPAVVSPDGRARIPDLAPGPPLGLGGMPFEATELELAEGSLLALFTNGLLQARDPDIDVALNELQQVLSRPDRPLEKLCDEVTSTLLPFRPPDDVSLLVARTRGLGPDRVASWELPSDPAIVVEARALATRTLAEWGLEENLLTAELVVSELVTNAIRHGRAPIGLRLIREAALVCEVSDGSSTSPHLRRAHADDEGGRGLFLVAQLTQRWGTRYTATGKTIWTEIPLAHGG